MAVNVPVPPDTDVILLKVPLEMDEKNQITFANATNQFNYFNGLSGKKTYDKFTYQRKDGTITLPELVDDIYSYNYVMYRNQNFSNKWFYAYIIESKFSSPNSTTVKIKTDVFQTWQFDLTYKPVFIEREHVNDDTIGAHTLPEGLDVGEYINNDTYPLEPNKLTKDAGNNVINAEMLVCFQVTELLTGMYVNTTRNINRVYSGLTIFGVESADDASKIVAGYDYLGKDKDESAIVSIFMAPKEFFQGCHTQPATFNYDDNNTYTVTIHTPVGNSYPSTLLDTTTLSINSTLDGYTPKNNKLYTYPYNYLYVTNNAGTNSAFHYEDFLSNTPKFMIAGSLGQGCSMKLAPVNYKRIGTSQYPSENYSYSIAGSKYPVCAWKSDYYTNWLAQNSGNIQANILSSTVGGFAMGTAFSGGNVGMGLVMAGVNLTQSAIAAYAEDAKAKIIPDQAHGNTNCSDVNFAWRKCFTAVKMSVRAEYARIIDDFFSKFGYKINRVKTPNITGRANWNYVKTIECYIRADIPQDDLIELQGMFDKGITFWHNPATFGDYSQSNGIV